LIAVQMVSIAEGFVKSFCQQFNVSIWWRVSNSTEHCFNWQDKSNRCTPVEKVPETRPNTATPKVRESITNITIQGGGVLVGADTNRSGSPGTIERVGKVVTASQIGKSAEVHQLKKVMTKPCPKAWRGKNFRHLVEARFRQSVFGRLPEQTYFVLWSAKVEMSARWFYGG
jgi:hypothetical protein